MTAQGFTHHAKLTDVYLVRPGHPKGGVRKVNMKDMPTHAQFAGNYPLHEGDIIYVSPKGLHNFNYLMQEGLPAFNVRFRTTSSFKDYGVTQPATQ